MEPLKPLNSLTEPDGRWAIFNINLPRLYKIADAMTLSEDVPEYVRIQFQQAQHLLVYSNLQFSLLSVALTQAMIAVEFALMTRWKNDPTRQSSMHKSLPGLKKLLEYAFDKRWLNGFDQNLITFIPGLRNALTHGEYTLNPVGTLELVQMCGKLIQHLFAPTVLARA